MRRKQIYLPEEMDRRLKLLAKQRGESAAQVVRDAVAEYLHRQQGEKELDPWEVLIGSAEGGRSDERLRVDEVVYGANEGTTR